jgi:hypothetical protein
MQGRIKYKEEKKSICFAIKITNRINLKQTLFD